MAKSASLADLCNQLAVSIQRGTGDAVDSGDSERVPGQLLGLVSPDYLLLAGTDDAPLAKGERIVVRTLQAGVALGFETTVREVVEQPVRLYFVDVPQDVETLRLRKSDRIDLFVPVELRYSKGKGDAADVMLMKGNMLDLSGGGCRVFTKRGIPEGTVVNIAFNLPGERGDFSIAGSVLDAVTQNALFCNRIKFFSSDRNVQDLAALKRWIQQNQVFADLT